jgi:hypothetical protein
LILIWIIIKSSMKKSIIYTTIVQILILVVNLLLVRLVLNKFKVPLCLENFATMKRYIAFGSALFQLGLNITIQNLISNNYDSAKANTLISNAITLLTVLFFTFWGGILVIPNFLSIMLFNSLDNIDFLLPILVNLYALAINVILNAYLVATFKFWYSSLLQLLVFCIIPLFVLLITKNLHSYFLFVGIFILIIDFIIFTIFLAFSVKNFKSFLFTTLPNGFYRYLGDLGLNLFLTLPILVANHMYGNIKGGTLSFGINLVSLFAYLFSPISLVLRPYSSKNIGEKFNSNFDQTVRKILIGTFLFSLVLVLFFELFTNKILLLYFGMIPNIDLVNSVQIIIIAGIFYAVYASLRGYVDGKFVIAINTTNVIICTIILLAFLSAIYFIKFSNLFRFYNYYLEFAFLFSMIVLSLLTIKSSRLIKGF